jgi:hypothetical protein
VFERLSYECATIGGNGRGEGVVVIETLDVGVIEMVGVRVDERLDD